MRTSHPYWLNSSTKKNAISLDVGISLEGKSLTWTEIDKTKNGLFERLFEFCRIWDYV